MRPDVQWRTMSDLDLPAISAIAEILHPAFYEASDVLAEKRRLYPNGAHVLEIGERVVGYVLSHPFNSEAIPPLNRLLGELPRDADSFYIHDLALLPVARRIGAAQFIVEALAKLATAQGFATMSLVAVNGSVGFWEKLGFEPHDVPELAGKLLAYAADARFMVRSLV